MLRGLGMIESGMRQVDVAEALNTSQSVISRLIARHHLTADVRERHTVRNRITTPVQDRLIQRTARRNPTITCNQIRFELMQAHNVQVCRRTIGNRLHEVSLNSRRPWRCQPLNRGNQGRTYRLGS